GRETDRKQEASLAGLCALVVDDEPDARELLRTVLERRGAEVLTASSFEEAIQLFTRERPGFVVSDIGMPGGDGYDLIREIRAIEKEGPDPDKHTPALALTAFASARARTTALSAGFDEHLPKPVSIPDLLQVAGR